MEAVQELLNQVTVQIRQMEIDLQRDKYRYEEEHDQRIRDRHRRFMDESAVLRQNRDALIKQLADAKAASLDHAVVFVPDRELTPEDNAMIDAAWEKHNAAYEAPKPMNPVAAIQLDTWANGDRRR